MEDTWTKLLESLGKYAILLSVTYLYIFVCAFSYHSFEGFDISNHENQLKLNAVQHFLLNSNIDVKTHSQDYLKGYEKAVYIEKQWKSKHSFNSITKSYVFVLTTHATLGIEKNMKLHNWKSKLLFIFTVPLGIFLYFLSVHYTVKTFASHLSISVMLIWREEDRSWTDKQRESFVSLKLLTTAFVLFFILWFVLGIICLIDGNSYLTELHYTMMILFKISCVDDFLQKEIANENIYAVVITLIYFTCSVFGYLFIYCSVGYFYNHSIKQFESLLWEEKQYQSIKTSES